MRFAPFSSWSFDEFEGIVVDGAQVVIEIPDCRLQGVVSEECLDVANVAGVLEHGDCGRAAEVVRTDAAFDVGGLACFAEGGAEGRVVQAEPAGGATWP